MNETIYRVALTFNDPDGETCNRELHRCSAMEEAKALAEETEVYGYKPVFFESNWSETLNDRGWVTGFIPCSAYRVNVRKEAA